MNNGGLMIAVMLAFFCYYTFWVVITPFVDKDYWIQDYFPDRNFAILIPTLGGVAVISIVTTFVGLVLVKADSN